MRDRQGEQAKRMKPDDLAKNGYSSRERIDKNLKLFVGKKGRIPDIHELVDGLVNPRARRI